MRLRRFCFGLAGVVTLATPALAGAGQAGPGEVIAKVREAVTLLEDKGPDAFKELRDPSSRFMWKDTYVFVVNCDADEVMANPAFPTRVGGDIKQHTDYAGKRYGPELCATAAKPGGGWFEYVWLRPGEETPERKISFVMSVPGAPYQVGAGIYDETIGLAELNDLTGD